MENEGLLFIYLEIINALNHTRGHGTIHTCG